jgi:ABC-type enterochelin transport system permease subunit
VQVNGFKALVPVGVPLVAVIVVAFASWYGGEHQSRAARWLAWTVTALAGCVAVIGMLTIGPFSIPVPVMLAVVCARSSAGPSGRASTATRVIG